MEIIMKKDMEPETKEFLDFIEGLTKEERLSFKVFIQGVMFTKSMMDRNSDHSVQTA